MVRKNPDSQFLNSRFTKLARSSEVRKAAERTKARGTKALKRVLVDKYVVRVKDIPDSYWQAQL